MSLEDRKSLPGTIENLQRKDLKEQDEWYSEVAQYHG